MSDMEWVSEATKEIRDRAHYQMLHGNPACIPDLILEIMDSAMADMLNALSDRIDAALDAKPKQS